MKNSSWGRLWGVLVKPGETFESIAERPTWAVALAVLLVVVGAATLTLFSRFDVMEMMRHQMAARHQPVPAGFDSKAGLIKGCYAVVAVCVPVIVYLLGAAVFLLFNLLGGQLTYKKSLAVMLHANMPGVVRAVLTVPVALSRASLSLADIQGGLLRSNLSFLAPEGAGRPLVVLLASCDLFSLWTLVLLVIGYRIAARVSRATAVTTVVLLLAIVVAVSVALSALGGAPGAAG